MIVFIITMYFIFLVEVVRISIHKKNLEVEFSISRTLLFGASTMGDIDEDDKEYRIFQVAFACFVITMTYDK